MSIKSFILKRITARPSKWDILLLGFILFRYALMIAWFSFLWEMLLHWNYMAVLYFQKTFSTFLPSLSILMSLVLLIKSKNWIIKTLGLISFFIALLNLFLNVVFLDLYKPLTETQRVKSPDGIKSAILYHQGGGALDPDDMIIVIQEPGQLFFPKTLYVNEEQSDLHLTWLDNQHIKVTTGKDLLCVLDIHAPIQIRRY